MPTPEQVEELSAYTTIDTTHVDDGYVVLTSTVNGNSIVVPFTAVNGYDAAFFWTNTMYPPGWEWNTGQYAYLTVVHNNGLECDMYQKYSGFPVRPVIGDGPQSNPEPIAI